jgi:uncharacterized caspase-like protein
MRSRLVIALALGLLVVAAAVGDPRIALVIGNGAYRAVPKLSNPANDAQDIAAELKELGFTVTTLVDADLASMEKARRDFSDAAGSAQVRLFFYAGHGVQAEGTNWLLPVDADVKEDYELKTKAFSAQALLDGLEAAGAGVNIVVLDACRDNPFKASSRSAGASRGLAVMGIKGSLIAYATAPGQTAADGRGRNGVFTEALLTELASPGKSIQELMTSVIARVSDTTGGQQTPWMNVSLPKLFYFITPEEARSRFGAKIAEGETALKNAEAELASLREQAGKESDQARRQALELEIKKKAALEAQKRQETEALKAERERQEAAAKAQAQEAAQLASFKSEQASREDAIRRAAEAKRRELESLKSGSGGVLSYIIATEAARGAQAELEKQYADSLAAISSSVSGTYDKKLAALASWSMDPWENEAEFKARVGAERSRLLSEKQAALTDVQAGSENKRQTAVQPFVEAESSAVAGLERARTVYKGSAVKLEVGAFDRDEKRFPITLTCSAPELLYTANFFYSIKCEQNEELKRRYLEFDAWQKAGALFGELQASVASSGATGFVNQIEAIRLRAVDASGEKLLYEATPQQPVSLFAGSADREKPTLLGSYLFAVAPGGELSVNGTVLGSNRAILANPKPGLYTVRAKLADGTVLEQKRAVAAGSGERVVFVVTGSLVVSAKTSGELWFDGKDLGRLEGGQTREVTNLAVGNHVLEMQYTTGNKEKVVATVRAQKVIFAPLSYEPRVICAGWYMKDGNDTVYAGLWQNGVLATLPVNAKYARAYAMAPLAFDVVVAGSWKSVFQKTPRWMPCYWIGGTRTDLPIASGDGEALAIAIVGGTIYTAGYYDNDRGQRIPCYWVGTQRTDLPPGPGNAAALAIAVSKGTVYVAGWCKNRDKKDLPCYWVGKKRVELSAIPNENNSARAIAIDNGTVYIAGYYWDGSRTLPCYWVGDERKDLPTSGNRGGATSIWVADGTVYAAGQYNNGKRWVACYWSGTTAKIDLPSGSDDAEAKSIRIVDGTIYVSGFSQASKRYTPCYWVGMKKIDLPGVSGDAQARSVLVLP